MDVPQESPPLALQLGNPSFQTFNDRLLSHDDGDQNVAAGGVQVNLGIHAACVI